MLGARIARAATPPGVMVIARARLAGVRGRWLTFDVEAQDGVETISRGTHERCIVERQIFVETVQRKSQMLVDESGSTNATS